MRHTGLTGQTNRQNDVIFVAESKDRDHTNRKYTKHTFVAESKDRDATKVGGSKLYTKIPVHLRVIEDVARQVHATKVGGSKLYTKIPVHLRVIEDVARQVHPHRSVGGLINWCVVLLLL